MAKAASSAKSAELASLELALGHKFANPDLLTRALTHRSQSFESAMDSVNRPAASPQSSGEEFSSSPEDRSDNERLEFLGDAILGLVVAESLFKAHPNLQEGELTRLRAQLVSRKHMGEVAQSIGLGDYLRLGRGEERSGGRHKSAILANAMEAVIAAVYLDANDSERSLTSVRRFAEAHILGPAAADLARELRSGAALGDHKSALQEYLQAARAGTPSYAVESESGPDHRKRFQIALRVKSTDGDLGEVIAKGTGSTKKKAEQEAARRALLQLSRQSSLAESLLDEEPANA